MFAKYKQIYQNKNKFVIIYTVILNVFIFVNAGNDMKQKYYQLKVYKILIVSQEILHLTYTTSKVKQMIF